MFVVAIGGGTGLSTLLRGLKNHVDKEIKGLTAIVTVADSGGSTGRLRKIYQIPAPGDIRNCIVALAESEDILRSLFQYRFKGGELEGHAFGNLFLVALTEITGSFLTAIRISSQVLRTKGEILPATLSPVDLCAEFTDGNVVYGEEEITNYGRVHKGQRIVSIWLEPKDVTAPPEATDRINAANLIVIGPGSLYTSIIPNLLVKDIRDAVANSKALKVFVVNAMTQPGETDGFSAYDHVQTFAKHTGIRPDAVVLNTKIPSDKLLKKYLEQGQEPVLADASKIAREGYLVYADDLIGEKEDFVRHDPERLASLLIKVYEENATFSEV
ncbi:gluconeogenesis factor YvcK family protein [Thermocrinis minervae]|uniref:Putative gluconeogenesis factor n=1 Tax=Thermocrinis minervae TaxID=381751 RepID=A0A1M6SFL8_9AQUI|nr:YvcK family protein [Thermocrinis minervae]SHK43523.1 conserved hypothetical protein, cofD-related [Thermocrinis minervae]